MLIIPQSPFLLIQSSLHGYLNLDEKDADASNTTTVYTPAAYMFCSSPSHCAIPLLIHQLKPVSVLLFIVARGVQIWQKTLVL